MFSNNQDEFEAFIQKQGKVLKGIEDYEESTLPPAGTNFIGVWSSTPIGRINIFHSNGLDGADNIQAWGPGPPPCPSDLDGNGTVNTADLLELFANWGGVSEVGSRSKHRNGRKSYAKLIKSSPLYFYSGHRCSAMDCFALLCNAYHITKRKTIMLIATQLE